MIVFRLTLLPPSVPPSLRLSQISVRGLSRRSKVAQRSLVKSPQSNFHFNVTLPIYQRCDGHHSAGLSPRPPGAACNQVTCDSCCTTSCCLIPAATVQSRSAVRGGYWTTEQHCCRHRWRTEYSAGFVDVKIRSQISSLSPDQSLRGSFISNLYFCFVTNTRLFLCCPMTLFFYFDSVYMFVCLETSWSEFFSIDHLQITSGLRYLYLILNMNLTNKILYFNKVNLFPVLSLLGTATETKAVE